MTFVCSKCQRSLPQTVHYTDDSHLCNERCRIEGGKPQEGGMECGSTEDGGILCHDCSGCSSVGYDFKRIEISIVTGDNMTREAIFITPERIDELLNSGELLGNFIRAIADIELADFPKIETWGDLHPKKLKP